MNLHGKYMIRKIGVIFVLSFFIQLNTLAQNNDYEYLKGVLTSAKDYTIEVFDAMPAEDFSFKPTEEVRTFAAQAYHIAYSIEWFHNQLKGTPVEWSPADENSMNKEELLAYVTEQFDAMNKTVMNTQESGQFTAGVMGVLRHNSHHRGQMVAYLRMNGIAPPAYK